MFMQRHWFPKCEQALMTRQTLKYNILADAHHCVLLADALGSWSRVSDPRVISVLWNFGCHAICTLQEYEYVMWKKGRFLLRHQDLSPMGTQELWRKSWD